MTEEGQLSGRESRKEKKKNEVNGHVSPFTLKHIRRFLLLLRSKRGVSVLTLFYKRIYVIYIIPFGIVND